MVRRDNFHSPTKVITYGFLVSVEAEEGTPVELMKDHLWGACTWIEGCGRTDVEYVGELPEDEN